MPQRRHVGADGHSLLPAAPFHVVVDRVLPVIEFAGEEVLEGASPYSAHEQVFAHYCNDLVHLEAGFVADGQDMVCKDLFEAIGPMIAHRPFDQPIKDVFAGHRPARVMRLSVVTRSLSNVPGRFDGEPALPPRISGSFAGQCTKLYASAPDQSER